MSGIWCKAAVDWKLKRTFFCECKFAGCDSHKEIKTVVTEKSLFDNRDESLLSTTFWKNWTINTLIQGSKSIVFQSNYPQHERSLLLKLCLKKLGLCLERYMRLKLDKSQQKEKKLIPGSLRISTQKTKEPKIESKLFSTCKVADCDPHETNENCSYGETSVRFQGWIIFSKNFLEFLDYQDFDPRININVLPL